MAAISAGDSTVHITDCSYCCTTNSRLSWPNCTFIRNIGNYLKNYLSLHHSDVEASWNVMAHAQKPNFVFRRNGRVHLKQRGRQSSRLLAAEVCASAVVMLETPMFPGSVKGTGYPLHSPVSPSLTLPCVTVCHHISSGVYYWYALLYNSTVTEQIHKYQLNGMDYQIIFKLMAYVVYFRTASMQRICDIKHVCNAIFTVHSACLLINNTCFGLTIVIWVLIQTSI